MRDARKGLLSVLERRNGELTLIRGQRFGLLAKMSARLSPR
jgi:hypothetical protein